MNCQYVYPLEIIRPVNKTKLDHNRYLDSVIQNIMESNCKICQYLADNLKRATGKCCLNHASLFPCEYCFARGVRIVNNSMSEQNEKTEMELSLINEKMTKLTKNHKDMKTLEKIKKDLTQARKKGSQRSHIVWPQSTANGEPRTMREIKHIIEKIENNEILTNEEKKGVVSRSPLFSIPNFNIVLDLPVDYMHALCIGVTKRMIEMTFVNTGEVRSRKIKRKLSSPEQFNKLMLKTKVVHEFPRRARTLQFSVMKATEYRNIVLFYFKYVIDCIPLSEKKERKLWLVLAYMIRSCTIPNKEFQPIPLQHIENCMHQFYTLYEAVYGPQNCTYNTHVVGGHLLEMRYHGPLTLTSTFIFESFYGKIRNSFVPGTPSPLKQMFQKVLLKRALSSHYCENRIFYANYDTSLECNTLVYCFVDLSHYIYKIVSIENETLICNKIQISPAKFSEVANSLDWAKVGVFIEESIDQLSTHAIPISKVKGKVLRVSNLLITCPNSILAEK